MKKLLSIGLLTLGALAMADNQAHAWVNCKFSVGLNWQLQSGNNSWLWGAWKNGQVPGPEAFAPPGYYPGGGNFPYFGAAPQNYPQGAPQAAPVYAGPQQPAPQQQQQQAYYGQPYNPYQPVSYQPGGYYYPTNYYPNYQPYYGQAPSYWYQGR